MTPRALAPNRRQFLFAVASAVAYAAVPRARSADALAARPREIGLASNVWDVHNRFQVASGQRGDQSDPLTFLQRCHEVGARGMQLPLGIRDADYTAKLRQWAEARELYIEGSIDLSGNLDPTRFEQQVLTAKAAGAKVIRVVVIPGRRYEYFKSADEFARACDRAQANLQRAEPIAAKLRMRIAVENHKCHRVDERLPLLKKLGSEWIGMCIDVGNSFSLCEDPLQVVKAYAPWAFSVHLKDQAVREYDEGFLFGDAPLGEGFLDLPEMIRIIKQARPGVRFSLEVMTRDPLKVPVLTERYWATMANVPAADLFRTLRTVKTRASKDPLPTISNLPREKQVECELANVTRSLSFAAQRLQL